MDGKGQKLLVGWGFQARYKGVTATEFFEDIHTTNTSEQVREDIWANWFFGAFIDAQETSFTVSAQNISLLRGYTLPVSVATFTDTHQVVNFSKGYSLVVSNGSFSTTYQSVVLLAARSISVSLASVTVSNQSVSVRATRTISVSNQAYNVTNSSLTLDYSGGSVSPTLLLVKQDYTSAFQGIGLKVGHAISIDQTGFTISTSADVKADRKIPVSYNTVSVTNNDLTIARGVPYPLDTTSYTVTCQGISLNRTNVLQVSFGDFTTSTDGTLTKGIAVKRTRIRRKYWLNG